MVNEAIRGLLTCGVPLGSVSAAVILSLGAPASALAQQVAEATAQPAPATEGVVDEVVVTSTRIVRDGYQAPTPTSVIGAAEIAAKAPANIADFVNELPAISGSTSPRANVPSLSAGLEGINALNLRALGANRTLVLLDGHRVAASTLGGLVDINTIPQALVKRVDVVTGGASADWGSDAVAGVVNFVLDKDFTGLKGQVQGGVTTYGDDGNVDASLTTGVGFAQGRGHFLLSGEIAHNAGITGIGSRKWYNGEKLFFNPAYTPTNGQPQLLVRPQAGFATATPGGIITSGPLKGTYFGPGGTPAQFNYGPLVSGNIMVGGDWQYADFGKWGDLDPELDRQSLFTRVSYEVMDDVELYSQVSYNRATSRDATLPQYNFANLTIQPDNAYIPASIAPRVTSAFTLGTFNQDLGPIIAHTHRSSTQGSLGAQGNFAALGSKWSWDVYGQRTVNPVYTDAVVPITSRYNQAIDAVRAANGSVVCRSTLANPNNGCVPFDVLGTGVISDAARDYVLGTSWGRSRLTQDVVAGTLRGELFSTWAGPISVATGLEHRREAVSGSNDALTTATTKPYFAGNFFASFGSYNVTEGFLETVVPLAKDLTLARTLDLNGAVRATDYSTSGYVTTWKLGVTYSPIDSLTIRSTRSRDIRAPNLAELFQAGQTSTTSITDPFRGNTSATVAQVTSGNLRLKPEEADTWGAGIVLQPRFLTGFAASVDYYDIRIRSAISTLNAATLVNQCFLGNMTYCSQITRAPSGAITTVTVLPVNIAKQISRGIDFETSYRSALRAGNLSLRLLATRFLENYSNDGITPATDNVGTNGMNGSLRNTLPKWRYLGSVGWDRDPVMLSFTARGFSAGVNNTSYIECNSGCPAATVAHMTIDDNHLPGAIYLDTNITVKLPHGIEGFLAVDNLLNRNPGTVPYGTAIGGAPLDTNPILYDVLGRTFRLGVRYRM